MATLDSLIDANSASQGGTLDSIIDGDNTGTLDSLIDGSSQQNGNINLNTIEQIESAGKNNAVSSTGAKGLYQFMPDTAEQYSKRLFGVGTRDASTLTPEQQNQMAQAYFNDLLKEFHGNVNEAVAAYNWGQGNVEKDIKAHGSNWLNYAPEETRNYVHKYNALNSTGYDHSTTPEMSEGDYMSNQFKQIGDLWNGLTAEINKHTGNEYSQKDIDEVKAELNTDAGKDLKTETAIAASVVAPELIPEIAEGGLATKGATWLAKGLASSEAYQGVENGKIDPMQTVKDVATGAALEGGLKAIAAPAVKQIKNAMSRLRLADVVNPEMTEAGRNYLAASRAQDIGVNWQVLRETNPKATLLDAYEDTYKQVPEMFDADMIERVKKLTRKYKLDSSPLLFTEDMKNLKNQRFNTFKPLAKTNAEQRLIKNMAEANEQNAAKLNNWKTWKTDKMLIPEEAMKSTLLQKVGQKADEYLGTGHNPIENKINQHTAEAALKDEATQLKKDIQKDSRNIRKKLKANRYKVGHSVNQMNTVLNRQLEQNRKMLEVLNSGFKGKKVNISDIQSTIKQIQEEDFNTGSTSNVTSRFKDLNDKMKAMNVYSLKLDKTMVNNVIKRHGAAAVAAGLGHVVTAGTATGAATVAGRMARASRSANLQLARDLVKAVDSGEMTEEQAEKALLAKMYAKAHIAGRSASALRENVK